MGTLVFRHHQNGEVHHDMCSKLSITELNKKAHVFRGLQSPQEAKSRLDFVTSMFADDYSTRNIQVANLVNGQIRRSAIDSHGGKLPLGMPHSAPKAYTDMLIRQGKAAANGNVSPANALSSFISIMEERNIAHSILNDTDVNGDEVVSAVVFHDEELAPTMLHPCSVYTADVTFGLTDASCGFAKWFFLSRLLPGIISV